MQSEAPAKTFNTQQAACCWIDAPLPCSSPLQFSLFFYPIIKLKKKKEAKNQLILSSSYKLFT